VIDRIALTLAVLVVAAVVGTWQCFTIAPERTLLWILGRWLRGRRVYFCAACEEAHVVPPLLRDNGGVIDWTAPPLHADLAPDRLLRDHEAAPFLVVAERRQQQLGVSAWRWISLQLTPAERARALAALRGQGRDDLVEAVRSADRRALLRELELNERADAVPLTHREFAVRLLGGLPASLRLLLRAQLDQLDEAETSTTEP
jgi:hypothetical protein